MNTVISTLNCTALPNEGVHNYKPAEKVVATGRKMTDEHQAALSLGILSRISSRKRKSVRMLFKLKPEERPDNRTPFPPKLFLFSFFWVWFCDCLPIFVMASEACEHLF